MPRSGLAGAVTWIPAACRRSMTPFQLEASAKAPWTRTTVSGASSVVACGIRAPSLGGVDLDDRVGERFWGFLRKVVPDAALDGPVRIRRGEFPGIGTRVRMWGAIGVAFEGDRRHGDHRPFGEPLLQIVVFRLAFGQSQPPAVVVDHDLDVIRVVERRRAAIERGIFEVPLRRSGPPNELREVAPVVVVTDPSPFSCKVVLVPPLELSLRRQRQLAGFLAPDQIPTHGDERRAAFRPERREDVGRPRSPVEAGKDRTLDLE